MTPDSILSDAADRMDKALDHLKSELRGIRTGRASTALVDYIKVDYYGSPTDLKSLASISVPEATQILIKPFDIGSLGEIRKAIEASDLGLNPQVDGKQIRIPIPALSTDRRKQLVGHAKKVAEDTKVAIRNVRRDANKQADQLNKQPGTTYPEDEIETLKSEIQDLLKKHETEAEKLTQDKSNEIMEV
ncbi:MAG: ribosome recycling factor [Phycisphaeraceae bacterium]|nr:MAG: ribosome recycling factor [Phycisphaeraceae bacterium]